jgi:ribosomal protein S4E
MEINQKLYHEIKITAAELKTLLVNAGTTLPEGQVYMFSQDGQTVTLTVVETVVTP